MFGSGQVNRPVHFVKGSLFYMCLRHGQCELSHHLARSSILGHTWQVNGIGVAKLLCSLEELIVGHRREERDHVVQPVVPDGGQLLRPSVVRGLETPHPLIKDGISKGVKNLQVQAWACTFIELFQSSITFKTLNKHMRWLELLKEREEGNLS